MDYKCIIIFTIVLRAFIVVISMCLLYVSVGSRVNPSIFWVDVHGECDIVYLLFKLCGVFRWVWCEDNFIFFNSITFSLCPTNNICHVSSMGRALAFRANGPGTIPGPV